MTNETMILVWTVLSCVSQPTCQSITAMCINQIYPKYTQSHGLEAHSATRITAEPSVASRERLVAAAEPRSWWAYRDFSYTLIHKGRTLWKYCDMNEQMEGMEWANGCTTKTNGTGRRQCTQSKWTQCSVITLSQRTRPSSLTHKNR